MAIKHRGGRQPKSHKNCMCRSADLECFDRIARGGNGPMKPYCRCKPHARVPGHCKLKPGCGWPVQGRKNHTTNTAGCAPQSYGAVVYSRKHAAAVRRGKAVLVDAYAGCICKGASKAHHRIIRSRKCCPK